jgi:hypothetical protein
LTKDKKTKTEKTEKKDKKISLHPMKFDEALSSLLTVKPEEIPAKPKRKAKGG